MDDLVNNWLLLTRDINHYRGQVHDQDFAYQPPRRHLRCKSGLVLSIQANEFSYSTPRDNEGPYVAVEIMIIKGYKGTELDEYITEDSVIGYLPVKVLNKVIENNGGIDLTKEKENGKRRKR